MISPSPELNGYSLLLTLLFWGMAAAAMPLPVTEVFVEFTTEQNAPNCHGVQVSEDLIATSPLCVQKARNLSSYRSIEIHNLHDEIIGEIAETPALPPDNVMVLRITLNTEYKRPACYPALYDSVLPPEQALAFGVDENHQLIRQPVTLVFDQTQSRPGFVIFSESTLPPGSLVFDRQNHLVCLSDSNNHCLAVKSLPVALSKRKLEEGSGYERATLSPGTQFAILSGVVLALTATIPTGAFFLVSSLKAQYAGMSASAFWAGILSLKYCSHCTPFSVITAVVSTFLSPCTGGVSCIVGYPLAAGMTAFNWINSYSHSVPHERTPIMQQSVTY